VRSLRPYAVIVATLAGVAVLSGCGADVHPGQAAVVGDEFISLSEVDDFAEDFCDLNKPFLEGQDLVLPMADMKARVLDLLVTDAVVHQYAEERGWTPPASYRTAVANLEQEAEGFKIPERDVPAFVKVRTAEEYAKFVYTEAGSEALGDGAEQGAEDAEARGRVIIADYREKADITIDPRFGTIDDTGTLVGSTSTLSVPVSTLAKSGSKPPSLDSGDTSYTDQLPDSQICR
jgi:hypothetical protein